MTSGEAFQIVVLLILLIFSAFFSASETAIFSLNYLEREKLSSFLLRRKHRGKRYEKFAGLLMDSPDKVLITILTGNMIVNIFASSLSEAIGDEYFRLSSPIYTIIIMSGILLVLGEMTPKNIAVKNSLPFSKFASLFLYYFHLLLYPVTVFLNVVKDFFLSLFPVVEENEEKKKIALIRSAVSIGFSEGIISDYELKLLESFVSFRDETASDVMLPRNMIKGIEILTPVNDVLKILEREEDFRGFSLIPVYRNDLDHIAGYIDVKDLIGLKLGLERVDSLSSLIKPVHPVPESKKLIDLMREMKALDTGMSLIVDEYGGSAGIVTFQSLVKSIFDYFYSMEDKKITKVDDYTFVVPGDTMISYINKLCNSDMHSESKTIAGFIMEQTGNIPGKGTVIRFENFEIEIEDVSKNKINSVIIRKVN